jgi:hypothetical protein
MAPQLSHGSSVGARNFEQQPQWTASSSSPGSSSSSQASGSRARGLRRGRGLEEDVPLEEPRAPPGLRPHHGPRLRARGPDVARRAHARTRPAAQPGSPALWAATRQRFARSNEPLSLALSAQFRGVEAGGTLSKRPPSGFSTTSDVGPGCRRAPGCPAPAGRSLERTPFPRPLHPVSRGGDRWKASSGPDSLPRRRRRRFRPSVRRDRRERGRCVACLAAWVWGRHFQRLRELRGPQQRPRRAGSAAEAPPTWRGSVGRAQD